MKKRRNETGFALVEVAVDRSCTAFFQSLFRNRSVNEIMSGGSRKRDSDAIRCQMKSNHLLSVHQWDIARWQDPLYYTARSKSIGSVRQVQRYKAGQERDVNVRAQYRCELGNSSRLRRSARYCFRKSKLYREKRVIVICRTDHRAQQITLRMSRDFASWDSAKSPQGSIVVFISNVGGNIQRANWILLPSSCILVPNMATLVCNWSSR